jgi:nucleoside-diphosphate-sugar epimerase
MTLRALMTGATGYIGGRLARRLIEQGWVVHAIVRKSSDLSTLPDPVQLHHPDGTATGLAEAVSVARPDVTFHLASLYLAQHEPEQIDALIRSNILLAAQLAQALVDAGRPKLVNTGTASQHAGREGYHPASLYAATKQACEDVLRFFHDAAGLQVVTLKIFDTYGAGDTRRKLVQLLVDAAISGEQMAMSPGEQIVDLTHVDDVVDAFLRAAQQLLDATGPKFDSYLLSGERHQVRALVRLVESAIGRPVDAQFGARPYRDREIMVPVEAMESDRLPGWLPRQTLREALPSLVRG